MSYQARSKNVDMSEARSQTIYHLFILVRPSVINLVTNTEGEDPSLDLNAFSLNTRKPIL